MVDMPAEGEPLFDALQIALAQAATIQGRKYRYGALLLAGDDLIPMKSGSNKKPFQRDNIHAEMSVLKGCDRPRGKDMLIARLAPTKRSRPAADGESSEEDAEGQEQLNRVGLVGGPLGRRAVSSAAANGGLGGFGKMLNARPCARCEAKMAQRGVRRCFFTLNASAVGVLEYNPDAG